MKNVKWKSENAKRVAALAVSQLSVMVSAADYNVRDFGAKGDGVAKDTVAIQSAIDTATAKGGGRVVFDDGTFLSGALRLKSGLELPFLTGRPDCPLTDWTFTDCSFRQVAEETLPDWRHHDAASWDRKEGQGFVMRHAAGFKFNNTEIDAL